MARAQAVSRIHPTTGSVTRRNSQPRMLAPLGQQPQKKEWTVADARALEASIADQKKAFSKAEERRLSRAISCMRNVPLLSAFNMWYNNMLDLEGQRGGPKKPPADRPLTNEAAPVPAPAPDPARRMPC